MKKLLFLAIVLCTCLVSCSKEDTYSRQIIGGWDVVKWVTPEKEYDYDNYKELHVTPYRLTFTKDGIVTYRFVTRDDTVLVEDTFEYTYSIIATDSNPKLEMNGTVYTIITLSSKELVISASDQTFYYVKH